MIPRFNKKTAAASDNNLLILTNSVSATGSDFNRSIPEYDMISQSPVEDRGEYLAAFSF